MDITKAFPLLMIQEGGSAITNTKGDKGGFTKYGIAQASHPTLDIKNLTEEQAIKIYNKEYWTPAHCPDLKSELQYIHFSCTVNCGVGAAAKILQKAAKVNADGVIGAETLNAAKNVTIQEYAIEWSNRYNEIIERDATQAKWQKGWQNRIDTVLDWYKQGKLV